MDKKNYHGLILLVILFTVIAAWLSFPIFFEWLITKYFHIDPVEYGAKFGAVGDTYGSLNTLISSIALCAVAYSTWLQVTSLRETRKANQKQLNFAKEVHDEQIKESKFTNFSNAFYNLLNFKQSRLHSLKISTEGGKFSPEFIFLKMTIKFITLLEDEWRDEKLKKLTLEQVDQEYVSESKKLFGSSLIGIELISYYLLYDDLFKLVAKAELTEEQQNFFRGIILNSITMSEFYNLVWISTNISELSVMVEEHAIFEKANSRLLLPYIKRFYDEKCLKRSNEQESLGNQNPA